MTKLSKRIPTMRKGFLETWLWLKELAEYVEFIDRRDRLAYRSLREQLKTPNSGEQLSESDQKEETEHKRTRNWRYRPKELLEYVRELEENVEYEPQTYDEAIALCKGWRRCVVDGLVHWKTPKGCWPPLIGHKVVSWEKDKWPELWKEMQEDEKGRYLYIADGKWVLNCLFMVRSDSTPGRVVCQAYIVFKGHADWAKRLSKDD